jgi:hypothetical protein
MDGADVANVGVGKTVTLEVPPGKHVLTAWLGGSPSAQNTIDFVPGETVQLECRMSRGKMDRSGELLTWIGLILGTIGFIINLLVIVIVLAMGGHP